MYLHILKKDLRRKKTMNAILLVFIALAATFIASSTGNLIAISTALDSYFDRAGLGILRLSPPTTAGMTAS